MKTMIALVGEQPIPNVVPVKHYSPERLVLAHTTRTEPVAKRIEELFHSQAMPPICLTDAYDVARVSTELREYIAKHRLDPRNLIFNLTGGTKPMGFAALELAKELKCHAFYYQSENNQSLIRPYSFVSGKLETDKPTPVDTTLSIDEVLRLFVDKYHVGAFVNPFEQQVTSTLQLLGGDYQVLHNVYLDSVGPNVEIDWILCYRNTVAVGEVKPQAKKTDGIDQINGVTDQRTLGTYTKKFIISAKEPHPNDKLLAEAYRIEIVVVPSAKSGTLSESDQQAIISRVRSAMEGKK